MDIVDTVFGNLIKEIFPSLDKTKGHAAMALAVLLSEARAMNSSPGVVLSSDSGPANTYNLLKARVGGEISDDALKAAGTRFRQYAAGNLAILLSQVCPPLADKGHEFHDASRSEYEGIRHLYNSLRRLAPAYLTDDILKKFGMNENGELSYLLYGHKMGR